MSIQNAWEQLLRQRDKGLKTKRRERLRLTRPPGYAALPLVGPPTHDALERESVQAGFGMITRLRSGWESGTNRFQEDGEILFGAFRARTLIGTAGLKGERRRGVARTLVRRVVAHAVGRFRVVRLSTGHAAPFCDSLGFARADGEHVTHVMALD